MYYALASKTAFSEVLYQNFIEIDENDVVDALSLVDSVETECVARLNIELYLNIALYEL